jgi:hypothetical protein
VKWKVSRSSSYKCFRRSALEAINLDEIRSIHYAFQFEMTHRIWRRGMKVVEVPIIFTERVQGHSKMSGHVMREAVPAVAAQTRGRTPGGDDCSGDFGKFRTCRADRIGDLRRGCHERLYRGGLNFGGCKGDSQTDSLAQAEDRC